MSVRSSTKLGLRRLTAPLLKNRDVRSWPAVAARIHDLSLPAAVVPNPESAPWGPANINIILDLLDQVSAVEGSVAECGVYRGKTLVPLALHLRYTGSTKRIFGFDSFEGFPEAQLQQELGLAGKPVAGEVEDPNKNQAGFKGTSYALVKQKLLTFGLGDVDLNKGYFSDTLIKCSDERFSFAHLDCDLYGSYKDCLEFFYPRLNMGGIILLDEYNDPPWPGCTKAVDEFLADKPERLQKIERQNFEKYFLLKK